MRSKASRIAVTTFVLLAGYGARYALAAEGDGLAKTPYPKFRGDAQNTGRGGGAGATGDKAWEFATGFEVYGSATLAADGTVYIVSNDHTLYAIDGKTGQKKWGFEKDTLGSNAGSGGSGQGPAVGADGTVYVSDPGGYDDANRGQLIAVDGATGAKKWAYVTKAAVYSAPAVGNNGLVYFGSQDGSVYAIDIATGKRKWKFDTDNQVRGAPAIGADGTIYVGSHDAKVYAIDGATGKQKWNFTTAGPYVDAAAAIGADGTVYIGSTGSLTVGPAKLYALDPKTGQAKWESELYGGQACPAIGKDGTIYTQAPNGGFAALDGKTGAKKWAIDLALPQASSPSIGSDGIVYVAAGHNLYALDPADGSKKWDFDAPRSIYSSPAIGADGTIYFGCADQKVYAVH